MTRQPNRLAAYLALAGAALVIYASLYPFTGWRDSGGSPFAFFVPLWPRYWSSFDLVVNVLGYVPLGFCVAVAFLRLRWRILAPLLATLFCAALSFSMESLQTWLPARVPSILDFATNSVGGLLGAVIGYWQGGRLFERLAAWQQALVAPVPEAELGLVLLALWLFALLSPETMTLGVGDVRQLAGLPQTVEFSPEIFRFTEIVIVVCNLAAVALFLSLLIAGTWRVYPMLLLYLLVAAAVRTLGAALLVGPDEAFSWWTPGVRQGCLVGVAAVPLLLLPRLWRALLAVLALMAATVLVNLAPLDPYSLAALAAWKQGHFLHFNGLVRLVSATWPFITLPYLLLLSRRL